MLVCDPGALERGAERRLPELRELARARHGADVRETLDAVRVEEREEFLDRSRRVADGEDRGHALRMAVACGRRKR